MKLKVMSVILGAALFASTAHADVQKGNFTGEAELAAATAPNTEVSIKGIPWKCESNRCSAVAADWPGLDSFIKQCRTVSSELGTLSKFRARGRTATRGELENCNKAAKK